MILAMMVVFSSVCFNFNILLPLLAKTTLDAGPRTFGIISACFGAGALIGALSAAAIAKASWRVMFIGAVGFGICELLIAPVHATLVAGLLLFVCGIFFTSYTANSNAAIQLASPDYIRGRVLGLYYYAWNGLAPLGALLVGWLCDVGGTELAFFVGGTTTLLITASAPRRSSGRSANGRRACTPSRSRSNSPHNSPEGRRIHAVSINGLPDTRGAGMAQVGFDRVSKIYPDGTRAVNDINLDIRDGEFMVLVGPSGCGKTTALRMVAGLEEISEGVLKIGDRVVNHVPVPRPRHRDGLPELRALPAPLGLREHRLRPAAEEDAEGTRSTSASSAPRACSASTST